MINKNQNIINIFFFIISLLFTIFFVGANNVWFNDVDWLIGSGDNTNAYLSWQYFKNDFWRFPIGKNPNYGLEISNSIIFTDNIPILAFFFKLLEPIIYEQFQYISFWICLCFFLQLFFSYNLLLKATNNRFFSLISSFLLLFCPFLLFRLTIHYSLGAHWLILYAFYISFFIHKNNQNKHWYFLLFLSLLIHLYFTFMIFIIYCSFAFENCLLKKKFTHEIKNLFFKLAFSLSIMFLTGYFESSPINAVSRGYGIFKIDLLGFFDPYINGYNNWSFFIKDLPGVNEIDSFVYIGLGNIFLFLISIFFFSKSLIKKNLQTDEFYFFRVSNILLILLFSALALSTNISFLGKEIISIQLPKYIFGLLSIFASTGRFIWPVIYLLIIISLISIYKNFTKKISINIILIILCIQIIDISVGFKNQYFKEDLNIYKKQNDPFWNIVDKEFEFIRTTYLFNNYGPLFSKASRILLNAKNLKTDIILNAAMDRKKAAEVRYELINNLKQNKIPNNTAYIIDNLGHLKQLKKQFNKSDIGFFFKDGLWIMLPGKKKLMNEKDKLEFNNVEIDKIDINKEYNIKFKGDYLGFGWSHNFNNNGSWSEGNNSYLLFKTQEINNKNLIMELMFSPYNKNINNDYELKIYVNNIFKKKIKLINNNKIEFNLNNNLDDNEFFVHLEFNNLIAPVDLLENPDARKLGILLKSFIVKQN